MLSLMFNKIIYSELSPKQKEIYNFQKISAYLADYGFNCIKLSDDWNGADFLAYHLNSIFKLQKKSKLQYFYKMFICGNFVIALHTD